MELLSESLDISREIGDKQREGNQLNNLGEVSASLGNSEKAIEFFEKIGSPN